MITIDGSQGEGGGQILRTAIGLSLVTGKPFSIKKIRAGRKKPGLLNQHLTAVKAALKISGGSAEGAGLGSQELTFIPGQVEGGSYNFSVGTAGSTMLVFQALLPGLIGAKKRTVITLEGGTHNPFAPPFTFLEKSFLPLLAKMGVTITMDLKRYGFYPAGGGEITITVDPARQPLQKLELSQRGEIKRIGAFAFVSRLPIHIARREMDVVRKHLNLETEACKSSVIESNGPGNVVFVEVEAEHVTAVFTGFGEKRVSAENVAELVVKKVRRYLENQVPVGFYLADQLLLPLALAGGGSFRTLSPTLHTITNVETIRQFLEVDITCTELENDIFEIEVRS